MSKHTPLDVIYLQWWEAQPSWCEDRIDGPGEDEQDDVYLLATPVREAAPDLLEALEAIAELPDLYGLTAPYLEAFVKASAAIRKALGEDV